MKPLDYSKFIERYLDSEMSGDELTWFTKEMEGNPRLQKEIILRQEINEAIAETDVMKLKLQLQNITSEKRKTIKLPTFKSLYIPAAAIVLIAIGLITIDPFGLKLTNQELFLSHYQPYEANVNFRSNQSQSDELIMQAYEKYYAQEYEVALKLFEIILDRDNSSMTSRFFTGVCYMETEQYPAASNQFHEVIKDGNNLFIEQSEWYLGLSYLAMNDTDNALIQFTSIANSNSYYSDKARRIAKQIK